MRMLRIDFDRCADIDGIPDSIHIVVVDGNAPISPIEPLHYESKPAKLVFLTVNHDVSTGLDAKRFGRCNVLGVWIGDVNGFVIGTFRVLRIKNVMSLWCSFVALLEFVALWPGAECRLERGKTLAVMLQVETGFGFLDHDQVGLLRSSCGHSYEEGCNSDGHSCDFTHSSRHEKRGLLCMQAVSDGSVKCLDRLIQDSRASHCRVRSE